MSEDFRKRNSIRIDPKCIFHDSALDIRYKSRTEKKEKEKEKSHACWGYLMLVADVMT